MPFAAPFVASYWLGAHAGRRELVVGLALGAALGTGGDRPPRAPGVDVHGRRPSPCVVVLGAPVLVGRLLRSRAALNRALREKTALLERRRVGRRRPRRGRRAHADRGRAARRRRARAERHDRAGHRRAPADADAPGARARRVRRDRDRRPRGARRAAPAARRAPARGRRADARAAAVAAPRALAGAADDAPPACR